MICPWCEMVLEASHDVPCDCVLFLDEIQCDDLRRLPEGYKFPEPSMEELMKSFADQMKAQLEQITGRPVQMELDVHQNQPVPENTGPGTLVEVVPVVVHDEIEEIAKLLRQGHCPEPLVQNILDAQNQGQLQLLAALQDATQGIMLGLRMATRLSGPRAPATPEMVENSVCLAGRMGALSLHILRELNSAERMVN